MGRKSKKKFYAVLKGHRPGVYPTWEECRRQVEGYSQAEYKVFVTRKNAEDYLNSNPKHVQKADEPVLIETKVTISGFVVASTSRDAAMKQVVIYADGACIRNPGPGGYGVKICYKDQRRELSAGFRLTTNNRMEILGCIAGLLALKEPCDVTIYSDSKYVVNAISKSWALKWRRNGWKRKDVNGEQKDVLNPDLWAQMLDLCDKHRVQFKWIRGHSGNEGNERCDQLARAAAAGASLGIDLAYENSGARAPHRAAQPNAPLEYH